MVTVILWAGCWCFLFSKCYDLEWRDFFLRSWVPSIPTPPSYWILYLYTLSELLVWAVYQSGDNLEPACPRTCSMACWGREWLHTDLARWDMVLVMRGVPYHANVVFFTVAQVKGCNAQVKGCNAQVKGCKLCYHTYTITRPTAFHPTNKLLCWCQKKHDNIRHVACC